MENLLNSKTDSYAIFNEIYDVKICKANKIMILNLLVVLQILEVLHLLLENFYYYLYYTN